MKCKKENCDNEVTINLIAYYANSKPVYHNLCNDHMKERYQNIYDKKAVI